MHKKIFQSLGRSDYQCPQCKSMCQVCNKPFEKQTNLFFSRFVQKIFIFEENQNPFQDKIAIVFSPTCPSRNCVYVSTIETSSFYDCKKCKDCSRVLNIPLRNRFHYGAKTDKHVVWWRWHTLLSKKDEELKNNLHFEEIFPATHNQVYTNLTRKRHQFRHKRVNSPLVGAIKQKFISILILCTFSLQ